MVRKPAQQEAEYVDRLAAVTDWLGIPVELYPAWTVAVLERELTLMNKLVRLFRDRGDEKAVTLLKQIDVRSAHLKRLIQHWSKWQHGRTPFRETKRGSKHPAMNSPSRIASHTEMGRRARGSANDVNFGGACD